jgi:tetratricopeptide (TPR) repeat protein
MLASADQAFEASNWVDAVARYEELYLYNPDFQTVYVEDHLFTSYVNAAMMNQYGSDSLESIQAAEEYYRKALALRPQDPGTKARQEQVRTQVEERLFYGYIDLAQKTLVEQPDSLEALNQANQYFAEALKIRPNDPEVTRQAELAYKYVDALGYSATSNWPDAIEELEYIYSQDANYAGGTARQALYEAHVSRGDEELAIGDFDSALTDFQRAAVLAQDDPGSKLRLYEIQLKIAEVMGMLGDYQGAVSLYSTAIEFAGLQERAQAKSANMAAALELAASAVQSGDYQEAYKNYREAVIWNTQAFDLVEHVVASGEYLSSIALDYHSTVSLIAQANNMANPNLVLTGQVLLVPILP